MSDCTLNFTKESDPTAFQIYEELKAEGLSCKELDSGYTVNNNTGFICEDVTQKSCYKNIKGVVEATEVYDYVLNRDQKYAQFLKGVLGQPVPWALDDLDVSTDFDQQIRDKIESVIALIKNDLSKQGIHAKNPEYKKRLAIALIYFVTIPSKLQYDQTLEEIKVLYEEYDNEYSHIISDYYHLTELETLGLNTFRTYLSENGGIGLNDTALVEEYSALDAIRLGKAACTEYAKILPAYALDWP